MNDLGGKLRYKIHPDCLSLLNYACVPFSVLLGGVFGYWVCDRERGVCVWGDEAGEEGVMQCLAMLLISQ